MGITYVVQTLTLNRLGIVSALESATLFKIGAHASAGKHTGGKLVLVHKAVPNLKCSTSYNFKSGVALQVWHRLSCFSWGDKDCADAQLFVDAEVVK